MKIEDRGLRHYVQFVPRPSILGVPSTGWRIREIPNRTSSPKTHVILFITQGVLNPMQWPLRNKKIRGITAIVLFLIIGLVILFFVQHESPEEKAIREWLGAPKRTLWTLWPLYLVMIGGACGLYILFFKVEERRRKYLGLLVPAVYFFCITLIPSWWNWAIGMAGMLAIILIGWLYPARNTD